MSTTQYQSKKYLRNFELREQIANLTDMETDSRPWRKPDSGKSRPFKIAERRQLARAVIGDVGPDSINQFVDTAIYNELQDQTGHDLNALIDARVGIGMDQHSQTGQRGKAKKFNRDELKQILEYLE